MTTNHQSDIAWKLQQAGYSTDPRVVDETTNRLVGTWIDEERARHDREMRIVGGEGHDDEDSAETMRCLFGVVVVCGAALSVLGLWKLVELLIG